MPYYDIAVGAVLLLFFFIGLKKGFVILFNRLLALIGAVVAAGFLFKLVASAAAGTPLGGWMEGQIAAFFNSFSGIFDHSLVLSGGKLMIVNPENPAETVAFKAVMETLMGRLGFMSGTIESFVIKYASIEDGSVFAATVFPIFSLFLLEVCAWLLLFIVSLILLLLLRSGLRKASLRYKAMYWMDRIFGSLAWSAIGLFVVFLLLALLQMLSFVPYLDKAAEALSGDETYFAGILYQNNWLLVLLGGFFDYQALFKLVADNFGK